MRSALPTVHPRSGVRSDLRSEASHAGLGCLHATQEVLGTPMVAIMRGAAGLGPIWSHGDGPVQAVLESLVNLASHWRETWASLGTPTGTPNSPKLVIRREAPSDQSTTEAPNSQWSRTPHRWQRVCGGQLSISRMGVRAPGGALRDRMSEYDDGAARDAGRPVCFGWHITPLSRRRFVRVFYPPPSASVPWKKRRNTLASIPMPKKTPHWRRSAVKASR